MGTIGFQHGLTNGASLSTHTPVRTGGLSTLIHEPLELLTIPGVAEIFHEFRELALGGDKLLAFFFQPREFSVACGRTLVTLAN
jgi:hypothetical protein